MEQAESKKKNDTIINEIKKDHHIRFWVSFIWYFFIYVIFLPITIGYLFSKVLLRLVRFMHYLIAKRRHSLKYIIFCNTLLSLFAIIISLGLFVFSIWSLDKHVFIDELWNYTGGDQIMIRLHSFVDFLEHYFVYGFIFAFSITYFFKLLLLVSSDAYIRAVKVRDQIQITKLQETGVTFVPHHPLMKIAEKWIDYSYGEKLLHHYELISSKERKNAILSPTAGQIISADSKIVFYKEYWKNHIIFCGGSKVGITNSIITYVAHAASQRSPIIYVDSVFDPQTRINLKYIAEKENAKITMLNFVDKNIQLNIYKDKNIDQITKLFLSAFDEEIVDKVTSYKITYLVLTLIAANPKTTIDLKTIIQHLDVKYLIKTYDKASNFELFNLIADKNAAKIAAQIKTIFMKFDKIYGGYFSTDSSAIGISDIMKSKNDILYINIPSHHSKEDTQKFSRLLLQDVTLMSTFYAKERSEVNKTVVFYTPLFSGLFLTSSDITISLATLTRNNIGLALEIKEDAITEKTLPVLRELFVLCKSYIIHKIQNETLLEAIKFGMDITHTRGVKAHNFESDTEIKYHDLRDKNKYQEFSDTIKNNVLSNIKELPSWKIYFKTLHFSAINHSVQFESIVYADFFSPIQFNQNTYITNEAKR